jgi:hypothetical protein
MLEDLRKMIQVSARRRGWAVVSAIALSLGGCAGAGDFVASDHVAGKDYKYFSDASSWRDAEIVDFDKDAVRSL